MANLPAVAMLPANRGGVTSGPDEVDHRGRYDHHPHPRAPGPPAEVEIGDGDEIRVEPAEEVPRPPADERTRGRDRQDVPDGIVLAGVDLAGTDPGHPAPGAVHTGSGFDDQLRVGPVERLRAEHGGAGVQRRIGQQPLQRVRGR